MLHASVFATQCVAEWTKFSVNRSVYNIAFIYFIKPINLKHLPSYGVYKAGLSNARITCCANICFSISLMPPISLYKCFLFQTRHLVQHVWIIFYVHSLRHGFTRWVPASFKFSIAFGPNKTYLDQVQLVI
jgi:hypothetical protein